MLWKDLLGVIELRHRISFWLNVHIVRLGGNVCQISIRSFELFLDLRFALLERPFLLRRLLNLNINI